jgi:FtsH-binding integral membrane protein
MIVMLHVTWFWLTQVLLISAALAQTTTTSPGTPTPAADAGFNPLWLLIIVALIAAAVWYFMRRRSANSTTTPTGASPKTAVYDRDKH